MPEQVGTSHLSFAVRVERACPLLNRTAAQGGAWFCLLFLLLLPRAGAAQDLHGVSVSSIPAAPWIEQQDTEQIVNFDLLLTNHEHAAFEVVAIRLSVFDRKGRLILKRELNQNGKPAAIDVVGDRTLGPEGVADLFQPFFYFGSATDLHRMHFEVLLNRKGPLAPPIALVSDAVAQIDVFPVAADPGAYRLPLCGPVLVEDGHDFFSHHRRHNLTAQYLQGTATAVNPNLFAFDLVRIDGRGSLYSGDSGRKQDWFSYGETVVAPADGVVVESVNDIAENAFEGEQVTIPEEAGKRDPNGLGNHVLLRHSDGRISWLLHMQPGSVLVKAAERVRAGQPIGKIGFSGDSLFPHLHYNVTATTEYPSQGVPVRFLQLKRAASAIAVPLRGVPLETGDIVDAGTCPQP